MLSKNEQKSGDSTKENEVTFDNKWTTWGSNRNYILPLYFIKNYIYVIQLSNNTEFND